MAIAGHVSHRMLAHYSHERLEAKRDALDAPFASGRLLNGCGTGNSEGRMTGYDTNDQLPKTVSPEVIENTGRPEWTRTIDLFRVKEAL